MNTENVIHPLASCESENIGDGTTVSAFSRILPSARIGENCLISDGTSVDDHVVLADRVKVLAGARIFSGTHLHDDVVVGPNACVGYSADMAQQAATTVVRTGAHLEANVVISRGITIGTQAKVMAGAVVNRSVPPYAIVSGDPAEIVGYVGATKSQYSSNSSLVQQRSGSVAAVSVHNLPQVEDMRGNLSVGEIGRHVPFNVNRYFLVYDVPNSEVRGEHAHKQCHQFLIAVKGSVRVVVDDGLNREEFTLNRCNLGLHLPPMIWGIQYGYSADAVLLVLASHHYDADDYIRDHEQFMAALERPNLSGMVV